MSSVAVTVKPAWLTMQKRPIQSCLPVRSGAHTDSMKSIGPVRPPAELHKTVPAPHQRSTAACDLPESVFRLQIVRFRASRARVCWTPRQPEMHHPDRHPAESSAPTKVALPEH